MTCFDPEMASRQKALHTITYGPKYVIYLDFIGETTSKKRHYMPDWKGISFYQITCIKQQFGGAKRPQSPAEGGAFCCFMQVIW